MATHHLQPAPYAPPRPPRRRFRWPHAVAAIAAAVVVAAGMVVGALAFRDGGEDPGVTACKISQDLAAEGRSATPDEAARVDALLAQSRHADLREAGAARRAAEDLGDSMIAAVDFVTACASHGVRIRPAAEG